MRMSCAFRKDSRERVQLADLLIYKNRVSYFSYILAMADYGFIVEQCGYLIPCQGITLDGKRCLDGANSIVSSMRGVWLLKLYTL